jgi:hypothetical protein
MDNIIQDPPQKYSPVVNAYTVKKASCHLDAGEILYTGHSRSLPLVEMTDYIEMLVSVS